MMIVDTKVQKERVCTLLHDVVRYARAQNITAEVWAHGEQSALVRLANSAVSLNTREELFELTVTACRGNARGSATVMATPDERERLYAAVHQADDIARHATPTSYARTFLPIAPLPDDDAGFDPALCQLSSQEMVAYVETAVEGLESAEHVVAGMCSWGAVWEGTANTLSDEVGWHALTDAGISLVLAHTRQRWELQSTQSAARAAQLHPSAVRDELATLLSAYQHAPASALPLGRYDIVFGREATAQLLLVCCWLGFHGGNCRRQRTFLKEQHVGTQVFSPQITVMDDPTQRDTFPYAFDVHGVPRHPFPLVTRGVFNGFFWDRDSADEFRERETGHSVPALSLTLAPGQERIASLAALLALPRERDLLYVPELHYMNVVHETEGIVTCCSRFGALLLRKEGGVTVPYNVRITEKLGHIFAHVAWLSHETVTVNVSSTYGRRTPQACVVPRFTCVEGVEVTHANTSF
ncbi:MAG: metallopeptidase TldD-related protein [bacterium]|nr:metallopeptidase TldD-related protein [bacterium]